MAIVFHRNADKAEALDNGKFRVAFSSEYPVLRTGNGVDHKEGEKYWEVLDHDPANADLFYLNDRGAFLDEHTFSDQIGTVESAKIEPDKKGRAEITPWEDEKSKNRAIEIRSKNRPHISFGYIHSKLLSESLDEHGVAIKRFAWLAYEISSVAVPADPTVGYGRSLSQDDTLALVKALEKLRGLEAAKIFFNRLGGGNEPELTCPGCGEDYAFKKLDDDMRCGDCRCSTRGEKEGDYGPASEAQYADPGYQSDKKPRYPLSTKEKCKAAWGYINHPDNAAKYTPKQLAAMKSKIKAACKKHGVEISDDRAFDLETISEEDRKHLRKLFMADNLPPVLDEAKIRTDEAARTRTSVLSAKNARDKEIVARSKVLIDTHGTAARGKLRQVLSDLQTEFLTADHGDATDQAVYDRLNSRALMEIVKPEYQAKPVMVERSEINDQDWARYSLGRALAGIVRNAEAGKGLLPEAGIELDLHQEMVRRGKDNGGILGNGNNGSGFWMPMAAPTPVSRSLRHGEFHRKYRDAREQFRRDLIVSDFGSGGATVPLDMLLPIIEPLRNWTALDHVGIDFKGGLSGNIVIPRQTGVSAPQAVSEIGAALATQPSFDQISLVPRRTTNQTVWSRQLVLQALPAIEEVIREDNFMQMALQIDEWGINGQGGAQPVGIMNQPGVFSIVFGGAVTVALAESMATNIRAANIKKPVGYLTTSNARGQMRSTAAALRNATTVISGQKNALWTGGDEDGMLCERPAFDSQQIPGDRMIAGAFGEAIWGQWGGLEVIVDIYTKAGTGEVVLTLNTWNDFAVRHPQGFTISVDSAAQ